MSSPHRTESTSREGLRLRTFIQESNGIEGIHRVGHWDVEAHASLLVLSRLGVEDLQDFVREIAGVELRRESGMDVRVGSHVPPPGGPQIRADLHDLLEEINDGRLTPYEAHVRYETLHPFLDGNGRSGRAVWAWQMRRDGLDPFALPFLHRFYYQSLDGARADES